MSQVPAKIRTTPAQRNCPNAASPAATTVSAKPTTVTWFGVSGVRPSAVISASARRRTQASNRVVNICHLKRPWAAGREGLARLLVDLDDLRRHAVPGVAARLAKRVITHPPPQLTIARQDDERCRQLAPVVGLHRDAVLPRLEHGHVARHLGRHHRKTGGQRLEEDDAEAP